MGTWASALFERVEEVVGFTEATLLKIKCLKEKAQSQKWKDVQLSSWAKL